MCKEIIMLFVYQVNIYVECDFAKDMLKKDDCYEIRIKLIKIEGEK